MTVSGHGSTIGSVKRFFNCTLGCLIGLFFAVFLKVLQSLVRVQPPVGPYPPPGAIVFWSHARIYLQQIDGHFSKDAHLTMVYLGSDSFLSYVWYPWHLSKGFLLFRPDTKMKDKPFHQIKEYLLAHRHVSLGIMTDSGGPYGKVKPTLLGLGAISDRPLVALKPSASASFKILGHYFPLPFSNVWAEFSKPFYPHEIKEMGEAISLKRLEDEFA